MAKFSLLSVLADVFLVGFVVVYSPIQSRLFSNGGIGTVLKENWIKPDLFIGLGIISMALVRVVL